MDIWIDSTTSYFIHQRPSEGGGGAPTILWVVSLCCYDPGTFAVVTLRSELQQPTQ